jgi:hypothetical protein
MSITVVGLLLILAAIALVVLLVNALLSEGGPDSSNSSEANS